tara:strand:- start:694 stop:834 length:141 start_codon:yes stop_codon:yes gene_type:complete
MQENMVETVAVVKIRNFAQADAQSYLSKTGEIKRIPLSKVIYINLV